MVGLDGDTESASPHRHSLTAPLFLSSPPWAEQKEDLLGTSAPPPASPSQTPGPGGTLRSRHLVHRSLVLSGWGML